MDQTAYNYCALPLAAYACRPDESQGRIYPQPDSAFRTCFQRDRDRIIHCAAFRRLKHKTQVFVYHEGDHYRTRLTHTLEVAQIARTMARALYVNEDLAEAVALAHDLGHTPFAHVGEDALSDCMAEFGGYDHNDQSLRVLVLLEHKYPDWRGLNLTWETLEGVVKHNGPVTGNLPDTIAMMQKQVDLRLETYASVEAQVAAIADDVAYNNHDVEDGLHAGLFTLKDIEDVRLLAEIKKSLQARYPDLSDDLLISGIVRDMIGAMVEDVLAESQRRIKDLNPQSPEDIRMAGRTMVAFSDPMLEKVNELRKFLLNRMYLHDRMSETRDNAIRIVTDLYDHFMKDYKSLPGEWGHFVTEAGGDTDRAAQARVVADYIAGMTDRYAIREHEKLFGTEWDMK